MSTYNPDSKWNWYEEGGRWEGSLVLKTKNLSKQNQARLKDIDWKRTEPPFAMLIEGEWIERGEMGWFGMARNEKSASQWGKEFKKRIKDIDPNTLVTVVDCHI